MWTGVNPPSSTQLLPCYRNPMKRRTALALPLAGAPLPAPAAARDAFTGVWNLVSFDRKTADGKTVQPYGPSPVGRLTYDSKGRMSAILMRPERRAASLTPANNSAEALRTAADGDLREMVSGFAAYYGTFDVDETRKLVIHHVKAALIPGWAGTDLVRSYQFSGKRLTLTVTGAASQGTLVWERDPD